MKIILVCLVLLFVASPVYANDFNQKGWNKYDTVLLLLEIADWAQTREIATNVLFDGDTTIYCGKVPNDGFKYSEANPILGEHPTLEEVDRYFACCILADYLIAKYASPKFHKAWLVISYSIEIYCVAHNLQAGVKFKF
jgi:hypothetical protein